MLADKENILALSKSILEEGKKVKITVNGTSMYPLLKDGDQVEIEKTPLEALKIGDIVVFENLNRWLAHRLIKIKKNDGRFTLITKGDSCIKFDAAIAEEAYIGKVTAFYRADNKYGISEKSIQIFQKRIIRSNGLMNYLFYFLKFLKVKFGV